MHGTGERGRQHQRSQPIFEQEFIAGNRRERGFIAFCPNMELFFRCFSLVHTHVQKNEIEFSFFSFVFSKNIFPLTSSREGATNISISLCYVKTAKKKLNPNERSFSPFFHIRKHWQFNSGRENLFFSLFYRENMTKKNTVCR